MSNCLPYVSLCVIVAALSSGCAVRRAYPGPERPVPEIATLHSAVRSNGVYTDMVRVIRINGSESYGPWSRSSGCATIDLLPGEYDFGVEFDRTGQSIVGAIIEAATDERLGTLHFRVRGGHEYVLHLNLDTNVYWVTEWSITKPVSLLQDVPWDPPAESVECRPLGDGRWDCPVGVPRAAATPAAPLAIH